MGINMVSIILYMYKTVKKSYWGRLHVLWNNSQLPLLLEIGHQVSKMSSKLTMHAAKLMLYRETANFWCSRILEHKANTPPLKLCPQPHKFHSLDFSSFQYLQTILILNITTIYCFWFFLFLFLIPLLFFKYCFLPKIDAVRKWGRGP